MAEIKKHKNPNGDYVVYQLDYDGMELYAFVHKEHDPINTSTAYKSRMVMQSDFVVQAHDTEHKFVVFKNRFGGVAPDEILNFFEELFGIEFLTYIEGFTAFIEPATEEAKTFLTLKGVFGGNKEEDG